MGDAAMAAEAVEGVKAGQRAMWSSGDYPDIARTIKDVADHLAQAGGAAAGASVLDVACGNGNVALAAARAGAGVVGVDITPALLEDARARAAREGLEVEWVEGDAEALPVDDGAFDAVLSSFGVMFAPRHEVAAGELVRACRPGGRIAVAAWTPEGLNGRLFVTMGPHLPPPPEGWRPPIFWGVPDYVRELLRPHGVEVETERRTASITAESVEDWVDYIERVLGPVVIAKGMLEPQGRWEPVREQLVALFADANTASDGTLAAEAEYLVATGTRAG